jgi:radical SAM protein with 4Fe4S-binding SPASM domain
VQVGVSLDGHKEAHNSMRLDANGKKTFDSVMRGWKLLKKNGAYASISFTLGSHNVNDLDKHIKWICTKLKPKAIGFNLPNTIPFKGNPATVSADLITQKLIKAYKIMQEHGIYEDRIYARRITPFIKKKFWLKDCCGCGNEIAVSPEGMVGPCHAFVSSKKYFIKRIPKDEKELKENQVWQEWNRRAPINTEQCQNCTAIALCGGGCPYYSYVTKGDIWALDERSCVLCNTTLTWLLKEAYSKIKSETVDILYRQPMHGDEERFASFVTGLTKENLPMGNLQRLLDPRFVTGMINLINSGKAACYFAEKDFEIIGFCNSIHDDKNTKIGVAVKKEHRGKGVATRLLELCLIDAKKDGFRKAIAEIYAANKDSTELFQNNGFVNTGKVSKIVEYGGKKTNELIFEKVL